MNFVRAVLITALLIARTPGTVENLRVHFFDVGQGDAVLIQSPSGQNLVYDGGRSTGGMLAELNRLGFSKVDLVIASHNHADHITGLAAVMDRFRPRFYMDNGIPATTQIYERVLESVRASGSQLLEPSARRISLGNVVVQVLPPPGNGEQNENSVGLLVEYGDFRLLLPGDAHQKEWDWWLQSQPNILKPVQVHKASHHGSRNGDTPAVLSRLMPETVVISVGGNNPYGHPDPETLALYRNAAVYRTDLHGAIVIEAERSGKHAVRTERGVGPRSPPVTSPTSASGTSLKFASTCIDLNSASVRELQQIVHVGEVRARQIIALRNIQLFRSVQDLTRVDGIASTRLRDIIAEGKACVGELP